MTEPDPANPLIVQADRTLALETFNPRAEEARAAIAPFAELVKSPEYLHTYRITSLSLWNATSAGVSGDEMVEALARYTKFPLPANVVTDVRELAARWGRLQLLDEDGGTLVLRAGEADADVLLALRGHRDVAALLGETRGPSAYALPAGNRGRVKQALLRHGWPVQDLAGYRDGASLAFSLVPELKVRDYQRRAVDAFVQGGTREGGSGVVVLPPGAGKTVVGLDAMARVGQRTLILTTNRTSSAQWRRELATKTTLTPDQIAEYGPRSKKIADVTLCTYPMLTTRARAGRRTPAGDGEMPHLHLFQQHDWGLVIYDEVHLLPAPVFRLTAEIQARRRLGLTATLVREDGHEGDVFSLIGPKRYDAAWRSLEDGGWIARATCCEVRIAFAGDDRRAYALAEPRERFRHASVNPRKRALVRTLLDHHAGRPALVIGQYLEQLRTVAHDLGAPLIQGDTPQAKREELFDEFRAGHRTTLVLSKVGNFALDLPEAAVMIQMSGAFGSRQEEAQRLGRLLRPKAEGRPAHFYTLVTRESDEERFAHRRQRFLTEQGYTYQVTDESAWLEPPARDPATLN